MSLPGNSGRAPPFRNDNRDNKRRRTDPGGSSSRLSDSSARRIVFIEKYIKHLHGAQVDFSLEIFHIGQMRLKILDKKGKKKTNEQRDKYRESMEFIRSAREEGPESNVGRDLQAVLNDPRRFRILANVITQPDLDRIQQIESCLKSYISSYRSALGLQPFAENYHMDDTARAQSQLFAGNCGRVGDLDLHRYEYNSIIMLKVNYGLIDYVEALSYYLLRTSETKTVLNNIRTVFIGVGYWESRRFGVLTILK